MRVRDFMTARPITVAAGASLKEAARLLDAHAVSGLPVVDGDDVVGVISKADIVRKEQESIAERPRRLRDRFHSRALPPPRSVREAMSAPPVTVEAWTSLAGAAWTMIEHGVSRLPVLERGRLVGILTRSDLVRAFARSDAELRREIVDEVLPSLGVSPAELVVEVRDGTVLLRGIVDDELDARCLPHAVRAVAGVVDVEAEIVARHSHRITSRPRA